MTDSVQAENTYEIGLVMAGAVSAGAYIAGVIDFFLEALEAWENAKVSPPVESIVVPQHRVQLRALSGTSGGAMSVALTVRSLCTHVQPVPNVQSPPDKPVPDPRRHMKPFKSPLYASWVQSIDIKHLLDKQDLKRDGSVAISLLDSSILGRIGENALVSDDLKRDDRPPWVAENLDVFLTNTNLTGVPYKFEFENGAHSSPYRMAMHEDYRHFCLSWKEQSRDTTSCDDPEPVPLLASAIGPTGNWHELITASIASGAFPIGLAPVKQTRKTCSYNDRTYQSSKETGGSTKKKLTPDWRSDEAEPYCYWSADGGVMNNEPLELVRKVLARDGRNERKDEENKRSVILIDPFPNEVRKVKPAKEKLHIVDQAFSLIAALLQQARFKPDEIHHAKDSKTASRYMIMPTVSRRRAALGEIPLASAALGGFGGFLNESIRRHDFQRGRYNAQNFLKNHYVLKSSNKLFEVPGGPTVDAQIAAFGVAAPGSDGGTPTHLPIIPLVGPALQGQGSIEGAHMSTVDLNALKAAIKGRIKVFVPALIRIMAPGFKKKGIRAIYWTASRLGINGWMTKQIMEKIRGELKKYRIID